VGLYLLKRLGLMVPLLIGITIISFGVIHLAPGSPIDMATDLNPKASAEVKERMRSLYGLDKPLYVQYWTWVSRLAVLDFGVSFSQDGRKVIDKISERLPITISLNILSLFIILLVAIPIGLLSATYQGSIFDKVMGVLVFIGFATPSFWLALLLMILFGVHLGWLPISGLKSLNYEYLPASAQVWDRISHLILPVFISASGGLAGLSRYMRSNMLEVIRQDYIITAKAKGLSQKTVIFKHALRNALLPVITILGLSIPGLIGGSIISETIFAIPGMGQLLFLSVMARDYPVIMGNLVIVAVLTLVGNLIADLSYALADPRIRET